MTHLSASVDRALELRLRPDLIASPIEMASAQTWVVKDPLTLEHYQFSAEEYALMSWLREPVSIGEMQRRYQREFSPQMISPQAIWDFLSRLYDAGLVMSEANGQGPQLLKRRERDNMRRWSTSWTSLLAIKLRGIDPNGLLSFLHRELRWLFSPLVLGCIGLIVIYALSLIIGHFDEFRDRLPELKALVDARNLPWLLLAIGGVKVLHELGHGLACKHFGGEVREMGIMFLVFAPCLYCDVNDAWRFPSKWQRIAVSAAGVIVEIVIAAIATIVWWYAQPGVLHLVALNVMFICTVNTLLVNGNPLLRYDGYYIASDFFEVPNLWQRSRDALRQLWTGWLLGQSPVNDPLVPASSRSWLAAYGMVSKVYMTLMSVLIVWGLVQTLYPIHLQNLAYAAGLMIVGAALFGPACDALRIARNPIRRAELRPGRMVVVMAIGLAAIVTGLAIPVNYRVEAPLVLMPESAARVYATVEGTLQTIAPAGRIVKRGQTIGSLENSETQLEIVRLEGEKESRRLRVEHLERLRGVDREANDQLLTARAALADSEKRLAERRSEAKRLTLVAPANGIVIPAPRLKTNASDEIKLATWSGSLLDEKSAGAHVEPGTLVCMVGDPTKLTAVLLVNDTDVKRLAPGQTARLRIDQLPGKIIEGKVVEIARHDVTQADSERSRESLATLMNGLVPPGEAGTFYEARVQFELPKDARPELVIGGRGEARVQVERVTLGRWIYRYLAQTFRLPV